MSGAHFKKLKLKHENEIKSWNETICIWFGWNANLFEHTFFSTDCSPHGCAHSLTQNYKHKGYLRINISSFCESSINHDVLIFSLRTSFHIIATTFERLGVPKGIYFIYWDYWIKLKTTWVTHLLTVALKYNLGRRVRVQIRSVVLHSFEQFLHSETAWNIDGFWMNRFFFWMTRFSESGESICRMFAKLMLSFIPLCCRTDCQRQFVHSLSVIDCGL